MWRRRVDTRNDGQGAATRLSLKQRHNRDGRLGSFHETPVDTHDIQPSAQQVNIGSVYSDAPSSAPSKASFQGEPISLIRVHRSHFPRVGFWLSDLPPRPPTQAREHVSHRTQALSLSFPRQCQVVSFNGFSFILGASAPVRGPMRPRVKRRPPIGPLRPHRGLVKISGSKSSSQVRINSQNVRCSV